MTSRGRHLAIAVFSCMASSLWAYPAAAYVGPGAGLSALGIVIAFIATVGLAIIGFLWYPLKRLFGNGRAKGERDIASPGQQRDMDSGTPRDGRS